jgi:hypothetical protein
VLIVTAGLGPEQNDPHAVTGGNGGYCRTESYDAMGKPARDVSGKGYLTRSSIRIAVLHSASARESVLMQYVLTGMSGIGSRSYLVRSSQPLLQARRERLTLQLAPDTAMLQAQCEIALAGSVLAVGLEFSLAPAPGGPSQQKKSALFCCVTEVKVAGRKTLVQKIDHILQRI